MTGADGSPSRAVDRGLAVLEAIAQRRGGMSHSEISLRLVIPKSSASSILRALERRGWVRRDAETGRYRLGLKVLALGRAALAGLDIRAAAAPILHEVVERSRLSAHLAILDHGEAVYVERVGAPGFVKIDTWVGRRVDVHSTSVGKAILAHLPRAEAEAIARDRGLARRTPRTITTLPKLLRELERVRARGYAVDDEENSVGVRCVAAPVFDGLGRVCASVGVTGTTAQVGDGDLRRLGRLVTAAARRIGDSALVP